MAQKRRGGGELQLPGKLKRARVEFEKWRKVREKRRIPEDLWSQASNLALEFGVHQTARALRLNYEALKTRVASPDPCGNGKTAFVEVIPPQIGGGSEGSAEMETAGGARLRVAWKGVAPDLARLSRSFYYGESS